MPLSRVNAFPGTATHQRGTLRCVRVVICDNCSGATAANPPSLSRAGARRSQEVLPKRCSSSVDSARLLRPAPPEVEPRQSLAFPSQAEDLKTLRPRAEGECVLCPAGIGGLKEQRVKRTLEKMPSRIVMGQEGRKHGECRFSGNDSRVQTSFVCVFAGLIGHLLRPRRHHTDSVPAHPRLHLDPGRLCR